MEQSRGWPSFSTVDYNSLLELLRVAFLINRGIPTRFLKGFKDVIRDMVDFSVLINWRISYRFLLGHKDVKCYVVRLPLIRLRWYRRL